MTIRHESLRITTASQLPSKRHESCGNDESARWIRLTIFLRNGLWCLGFRFDGVDVQTAKANGKTSTTTIEASVRRRWAVNVGSIAALNDWGLF
jgi:hypothetical protein